MDLWRLRQQPPVGRNRQGDRRHYGRGATLALLAAMPFAACGAGERPSAQPVIRDSAGIRIVENRAPAWTEAQHWRVAGSPRLDIGVLDGASQYQLYRVVDAARLSDGRIVVANAGTSELRYYGPDGTYLLSVGRRGGGPREFERIGWIQVTAGDSLLAYDSALRRLSTLDPAGRFVASRTMRPVAGAARVDPVGQFADGSYLLQAPKSLREMIGAGSGLLRIPFALYRATGPDAPMDSLAGFPGSELYLFISRSGGEISSIEVMSPPYMHSLSLAMYGDRFYVGSQDGYEIAVHSFTDSAEQRIRWTGGDLAATADLFERYKADRLAGAENAEERRAIERGIAELEPPATVPAYGDILADALGNLWVEEFRLLDEDPNRWRVFDAVGRLLGVVELPAGLDVYQIGADFVLGGWQDQLDVEHVRLYELIKPSEAVADR